MADVLLDRPHVGHLGQVGVRRHALGPIGGGPVVGGGDQRFEVGWDSRIDLFPLVDFEEAGLAGRDVGVVLALVEVLRRFGKGPEALFQRHLVEVLDVEVHAVVHAVDQQPGEAGARRRHPGRPEGLVGQGLVNHRRVLDHVVEGHLPQAEERRFFGEFELEARLLIQRPEGPEAALEAYFDRHRGRERTDAPRRAIEGFRDREGAGLVVALRVRFEARDRGRRQLQLDHDDQAGAVHRRCGVQGGGRSQRRHGGERQHDRKEKPKDPPLPRPPGVHTADTVAP